MIEAKPKRKHAPYLHRRLHRFLLVWMVVTFLAAFYPLIWLVPPYIQLTPYLYLIASLGWMPFAFRHIRRHGWRWVTVVLMVGCLAGNGVAGYSMFARHYPYTCEHTNLVTYFEEWLCVVREMHSDDVCDNTYVYLNVFERLPFAIYSRYQVGCILLF